MPDRPTTPSNAGDGPSEQVDTTWHGSDEPPAPWEVNTNPAPGASDSRGSTDSDPQTLRYPPAPPQRTATPLRQRSTAKVATVVVAGLAVLAVIVVAGASLLSHQAPGAGWNAANNADSSAQSHLQSAPGPVTQASGTVPDWAATAEAVAPSVVSITVNAYQGSAQGSGVVLDAQGHIVTNHHVVAGASDARNSILVTLNDKRTYSATIVGSDQSTDLAVLAMQSAPQGLRPITLGDSDQLKVGLPVMAIGNPLGLSGTVTTGIVSALDRPVITSAESANSTTAPSDNVITNAIQISAAINPGNSGGALVNASGQLIGINSSIAQTTADGGNIGIGFAIPVNAMKNVVDQILANGRVQHAFLGVSTRTGNVPDGDAQRAAAVVAQVTAGSPAAAAGIRVGDAVVGLDGDTIDGNEALVAQVRDRKVGQQVKITIVRGGARQELTATLGTRPQDSR